MISSWSNKGTSASEKETHHIILWKCPNPFPVQWLIYIWSSAAHIHGTLGAHSCLYSRRLSGHSKLVHTCFLSNGWAPHALCSIPCWLIRTAEEARQVLSQRLKEGNVTRLEKVGDKDYPKWGGRKGWQVRHTSPSMSYWARCYSAFKMTVILIHIHMDNLNWNKPNSNGHIVWLHPCKVSRAGRRGRGRKRNDS